MATDGKPRGRSFDEPWLEAAIQDAPGTEMVDEEPASPLLPFDSQAFKIYRVRLSQIQVGGVPALAYVYQPRDAETPLALRFETARMTDADIDRVGAELTRESVDIFERICERCSSEPLEHGQMRCSRTPRSRKPITIDCLSGG